MDLLTVQTPLFNVVMGVITVVSLAFAVYSHYSNSSKQKLRYAVAGRTILSRTRLGSFADVEISAAGETVSDLYYVAVLVFNSGSMAVEPQSLAEGNIKIGYRKDPEAATRPHIILSRIAAVDDPAGEFQLHSTTGPKEDEFVSFNFVAPKSGFTVEMISTMKPADFYARATTKSFGAIRKSTPFAKLIVPVVLISPVLAIVSAFPLSDYIGAILAKKLGYQPFDAAPSFMGFVIGVVVVALLGVLLFLGVKRSASFVMKPSILKFYQELFTN